MHCKEQFTEADIPDLSGYVAIVTGGNGGIGFQTTLQLALRRARVYIASRSEERVNKAIEALNKGAGGQKLDLRFLQIDLQNLSSVKAAAASLAQRETRLDILVNNAGVRSIALFNHLGVGTDDSQIMGVPYELTKDGYELQWQVNYLSPYLFVQELLPLMLQTASQCENKRQVRIVNISSEMTFMLGPKHIVLDDVNMTETKGMTSLLQRYAHSKQGSIRHAKELNDRYSAQGVTAYSLHPGVVHSGLQGQDPSMFGSFMQLAMKVTPTVTPLEGALNTLYAATSPEAATVGQGRFFVPVGKLSKFADKWLDDRTGNIELWNHSERAVRDVQ